jgi:hypothetical protein
MKKFIAWLQLINMVLGLLSTLNNPTATADDKTAVVVSGVGLLDSLFPKSGISAAIGTVSPDDASTILDLLKNINAALTAK